MIFNAKPWYNEPGREYHLNPTASNDYNATTWKNTIQYATLHWLKGHSASRIGDVVNVQTVSRNTHLAAGCPVHNLRNEGERVAILHRSIPGKSSLR